MNKIQTPGPLPLSVAEYWESTARSLRKEATLARDFEPMQINLRDATAADAFATRVREHAEALLSFT